MRKVRSIKRFVKQKGQPITITVFESTETDDDYGTPTWTPASVVEVTGFLSFSRRSIVLSSEAVGKQYVIDAEIFIRDEDFDEHLSEYISVPMNPEGRRPEAKVGDAVYDLFEVEQPGHGLTRFICQKKKVT